jgi:predicted membrane chloride channel (bestrophin family)
MIHQVHTPDVETIPQCEQAMNAVLDFEDSMNATERTKLMDPLLDTTGHLEAGLEASPQGDRRAQTFAHRTVEYNPEKHKRIIFQIYGSVWPRVFPWCVAVTLFTYVVSYLKQHEILNLSISNSNGHNFMSLLVSFLIVTRVTVVYHRFMEARQHLADLYRSSREVVTHACVLTARNTNAQAVEWRRSVAYRTILTLRMATAAMEFRSHGISAMEIVPDHNDALLSSSASRSMESYTTHHHHPLAHADDVMIKLAHAPRTDMDINFRAPIVFALGLRQEILVTRADPTILPTAAMFPNEELKILTLVSDMLAAYHGATKLITTPFPFPLVQMTCTFLLFWVFSLPLVLIADNDKTVEVMVVMFFLSYGFLGLEYVNRELEDPYGNDPNDFPGKRWEAIVNEDIYITLLETDGLGSALQLRKNIDDRIRHGEPLENYRNDISRPGFWASTSSHHFN